MRPLGWYIWKLAFLCFEISCKTSETGALVREEAKMKVLHHLNLNSFPIAVWMLRVLGMTLAAPGSSQFARQGLGWRPKEASRTLTAGWQALFFLAVGWNAP